MCCLTYLDQWPLVHIISITYLLFHVFVYIGNNMIISWGGVSYSKLEGERYYIFYHCVSPGKCVFLHPFDHCHTKGEICAHPPSTEDCLFLQVFSYQYQIFRGSEDWVRFIVYRLDRSHDLVISIFSSRVRVFGFSVAMIQKGEIETPKFWVVLFESLLEKSRSLFMYLKSKGCLFARIKPR